MGLLGVPRAPAGATEPFRQRDQSRELSRHRGGAGVDEQGREMVGCHVAIEVGERDVGDALVGEPEVGEHRHGRVRREGFEEHELHLREHRSTVALRDQQRPRETGRRGGEIARRRRARRRTRRHRAATRPGRRTTAPGSRRPRLRPRPLARAGARRCARRPRGCRARRRRPLRAAPPRRAARRRSPCRRGRDRLPTRRSRRTTSSRCRPPRARRTRDDVRCARIGSGSVRARPEPPGAPCRPRRDRARRRRRGLSRRRRGGRVPRVADLGHLRRHDLAVLLVPRSV